MSDEDFENRVAKAIDELPSWVKGKLENVVFLVRRQPTNAQRTYHQIGARDSLYGVYEGVPLSDRGNEVPAYPDTITIFSESIRAAYTHDEEIDSCIRNTIWHEVAHYFGYDEEWVAEEEVRRGKTL